MLGFVFGGVLDVFLFVCFELGDCYLDDCFGLVFFFSPLCFNFLFP